MTSDRRRKKAIRERMAATGEPYSVAARELAAAKSPVPSGCGPACWTPVACPRCGNDLPPRGRSMPAGMGIMDCCDEARMNPAVNPRHLWSEAEADEWI